MSGNERIIEVHKGREGHSLSTSGIDVPISGFALELGANVTNQLRLRLWGLM
jgi:hypothetical protein